MSRRLTMIDLFAGAGGLSLGLEAAGFTPLLAVEQSEMAAETYFRNLIDPNESAWLSHVKSAPPEQIARGLAVSPTAAVLQHTDELLGLKRHGELDLLAGGPPCQGFSLAGLRDPGDRRNRLPFEFLEFVKLLQPRIVLVENVVGFGISFSRHPEEAALEQLRMALADARGYVAQILEVNARDFGVAQFRPRVMIAAIRRDLLAPNVAHREDAKAALHWLSSRPSLDPPLLAPVPESAPPPTVAEAIGDLVSGRYCPESPEEYSAHLAFARRLRLSEDFPGLIRRVGSPGAQPNNHEQRKHSETTRLRFEIRLALAAQGIPADSLFFAGHGASLSDLEAALRQVRLPLEVAGRVVAPPGGPWSSVHELAAEIHRLQSLKHSQTLLEARAPSRTILTLPDDLIHYQEPRILTVREAARIQSFPDAFRFYSKPTTGGMKRRVEVPHFLTERHNRAELRRQRAAADAAHRSAAVTLSEARRRHVNDRAAAACLTVTHVPPTRPIHSPAVRGEHTGNGFTSDDSWRDQA